MATNTSQAIIDGNTAMGIELGSTRIKAVLIGPDHAPIAVGSHDWENQFIDRTWTYSLDAVWGGIQACYAALVADVQRRYDVELISVGAFRQRTADAVSNLAQHQHRRGRRAPERRVRT